MEPKKHNFKTKLWLYSGPSAWHFITVPKKIAHEIKNNFGALEGGWGSLPVKVAIGETRWQTSIFWDSKEKSYILPIKAKVRKQENIKANSLVKLSLELLI